MAKDNRLKIERIKSSLSSKKEGFIKAVYEIYWSINIHEKETYDVSIKDESGTLIGNIKKIVGTSCRITIQVDPEKYYYATVAATIGNTVSAPVRLMSEPTIQLNHVTCEKGGSFQYNQSITGPFPKEVQLNLQDKEHFYEKLSVSPYCNSINFNQYQIKPPNQFFVNAGCLKVYEEALIIQEIMEENRIFVDIQTPVLEEIKVLGWQEQKYRFKIVSPTVFLTEDIQYFVRLFCQDQFLLEKASLPKEDSPYLNFEFDASDFLFGMQTEYQIEILAKNKVWTSVTSEKGAIFLNRTEVLKSEYLDQNNIQITLKKEHNIVSYTARITKSDGEIVTEKFFGPALIYPFRGIQQIEFARNEGRTTGEYSLPFIIEENGYYMTECDNQTIVFHGKTPELNPQDIRVRIPITDGKTQTIGPYSLQREENDAILTLDKEVWNFSGNRDHLKLYYQDFLKQQEEMASSDSIYLIKKAIAMHLPQTMEEMKFYHYGYHNDKKIDLFSGMVLKVEYGYGQSIKAETDKIQDTKYLNGFVGGQIAYYPVLRRQGRFLFDPVIGEIQKDDSNYLDGFLQPQEEKEHSSYGGSGVADFMYPSLQQPYGAILYPIHYLPIQSMGTGHTNENVCLVMAESLDALDQASNQFRKYGIVTTNAAVAYMKGRVHIIPSIVIRINKQSKIVPVFTTLGDIFDQYGIQNFKKMKRNGETISSAVNLNEYLRSLLLLQGDILEL